MSDHTRPTEQQQVEVEYRAVLERLHAMNASLGIKPWQTSIHWPGWRNPHPPGTAEHAKLQEVRAAAVTLEKRRAELRAQIERFDDEKIAANVAAVRVRR